MENVAITENTTSTLTLYRQLFNHLDLSAFNPSELLDRPHSLPSRLKGCATA